MSTYEHRPVNPNRNCVTRSGNTGGHYPTDRHPSDTRLDWSDWLLIAVIIAAMVCAGMGVTVFADVPLGGVR